MKSKIISFLFAAILFSFNCYAQTVIEMTKNGGGVYEVPCVIDGIPMSFIFDTGASDVSISLTEARFLYKQKLLTDQDIVGTQNYSNANGDVTVGMKIILRSIVVGGIKITNVEASIVNNGSAPLLLGQTAMAKLGKFEFDSQAGTLTFPNAPKNYVKASQPQSGTGEYSASSSNNAPYSNASSNPATWNSDAYYANLPTRSGNATVLTNAPILKSPDMVNSVVIGMATNNHVNVIRKENPKYYYVESSDTSAVKGYMWAGWFK